MSKRRSRSGKCPVCRYTARLRADGTMGGHRIYHEGRSRVEGRGSDWNFCQGEGKPPLGGGHAT